MGKNLSDTKLIHGLELVSKFIALIVCVGLLLASVFTIVDTFQVLFANEVDQAIQDGLFVLILLEMFYITRSFIKYGSINVGIVVNVGIIASIKELIFQLDSMTLQLGISFALLFLSLSIVYLAETYHFQQKKS